ncbi:ferredoxin [uncultured Cohaesibacter sp.]|uniref:ferredoxin n=1 Tax=uncultured Cohaesibacter sp. TaxID=1002546 RepID=UPI00292D1751|nr:ferredoxin [uncultured Cohaesibacter sp.]
MHVAQASQQTQAHNENSTSAPDQISPLRPALFGRYRELNKLRYDFPLVLIEGETVETYMQPLSQIIDEALRQIAPKGPDGEQLRLQVLRLEQRMRDKVADGAELPLSELWRVSEAELVAESGQAAFGPLDSNLDKARRKVKVDGKVIGCDEVTPAKVIGHVWQALHKSRGRQFRNRVDRLVLKLNDILKSDHIKSDEAHSPAALLQSMGHDGDNSIDFSALSDILHRVRPEDRLPLDRVQRIRHVLHVLQTQAFFGPGRATFYDPEKAVCYSYVFRSSTEALDAYRDRLPAVIEFTKALAIAEMEVENKYVPALHDPIFENFDESDLTERQVALLPPALILLRDGVTDSAEIARAYEALACGLPIKVMIQVDDVLGPTSPEPPRNSFGAGTGRLASMAMGLNNAFALQCTSAHLVRMQDTLVRAMQYGGPSMFSIYSGATKSVPGVPAYILAAAATEARAFPSFSYDPSAGSDLKSRFDLSNNPQVTSDWPNYEVRFEDQTGERQAENVQFTFGDFAICDTRYQRFCQKTNKSQWSGDMVPFAEWLQVSASSEAIKKAYALGLDPQDQLSRVVVEDKIVIAARHCMDAWHHLQELAGINNSHALALLAEDKKKRDAVQVLLTSETETPSLPEDQPQAAASAPSEPAAAPEGEDADSGELEDGTPWIETSRCTTCNECQQINDKLFGYNENMQAFIADPDAGTFRQLVEAAESCQVSIIHPGEPRNPNEPDLEDLIERAKPFQ